MRYGEPDGGAKLPAGVVRWDDNSGPTRECFGWICSYIFGEDLADFQYLVRISG